MKFVLDSEIACVLVFVFSLLVLSQILLVGEVIKLACSLGFIIVDSTSSGAPIGPLKTKLMWLVKTSLPMTVPAAVYLVMNMVSFVALQRIDAGLFTVIAQVCLVPFPSAVT